MVEADEVVVGMHFQDLSVDNIIENENFMASFKDAQQVVCNDPSKVWGKIVDSLVNKNRAGLGFSSKNGKGESMKPKTTLSNYQNICHNGGYLQPTVSGINAIMGNEVE